MVPRNSQAALPCAKTGGARERRCTLSTNNNGLDLFTAKINPGSDALFHSSFLGGTGHPDLIVQNLGDNTVQVFTIYFSGIFFISKGTYATGRSPFSLTGGDFNGDGVLDLAVANLRDGTVGVSLGKGDGTFLPQTTRAAGTQPYSLLSADFNGDGRPDQAVTSFLEDTVGVLLQSGSATSGKMKITPPKSLHPFRQTDPEHDVIQRQMQPKRSPGG